MLVGVPKEIKSGEARVGVTPGAAAEYVAHGHKVLVETGAGAGIGMDDDAYAKAGATIAATAAEIFRAADMVVRVKEPQPAEWAQLRKGQILYTYLHLAADAAQARGLMQSGVTAIAYETVTDDLGGLPLLAPMSEVAGRLSIQAAATALHQWRPRRFGGVPGPPRQGHRIGGGVSVPKPRGWRSASAPRSPSSTPAAPAPPSTCSAAASAPATDSAMRWRGAYWPTR
jgi:alanine dehydrogenase